MRSLVIRAPLMTESGYGTHSRQVYKWARKSRFFNKVSTQPVPWGITTWSIDSDAQNGIIGEIMARSSPENKNFDVSIQVQLPNEWDPNLGRVNIGVTAAVETDRCNPEWIDACNRMNAVIVPSRHTKKTLQNSGALNVPVYVVPESYFETIDLDNDSQLPLDLSAEFNFLAVGQVTGHDPETDRKNTFHLVKWFCEEFSGEEDVALILKTNSGRNTKIDRNITRQMTEKLVKEVRKGEYPKVHLLHGSLTEDEMACLYRHPQVRAFVSVTRGEGFGLPLLEAAASGLPVVATNWSAHLDFLNKGKFIPVNYTLKEISDSRVDNNVFMKGTKWAYVDESDFKKKIRKLRKSPALPEQWAKSLREEVKKFFSQEAIEKEYETTFEKILR